MSNTRNGSIALHHPLAPSYEYGIHKQSGKASRPHGGGSFGS